MPAPNDLTPEEEAMFASHGVPSAGQGSEPVVDGEQAAQQGAVTESGQPIHQSQQHGDRDIPQGQQQEQTQQGQQQEQPQQIDRDALRETIDKKRPNGQFKSKEEIDTELEQLIAQGQQGQQGQQPPQGFVPHQALHEARQRAQQVSQQLALAQARLNAILMAQQQGQQGPQQQMPDLSEDPVGYIKALEGRLNELQQERAQEQQFRQVDMGLEQDEAIFSQSVPDYEAASDYYVESRAKELLQFYPPQEAQRLLTQEARAIAAQAWQRGMSAAQTVYQLAMARGYNPNVPNPQPQGQQPQGQQPQGQQPQGQQRGAGQAAVQQLQNNQQNGPRSLSGGSGGLRTESLNAEALLQMSDEEFENYLGLGTKGATQRFASIG